MKAYKIEVRRSMNRWILVGFRALSGGPKTRVMRLGEGHPPIPKALGDVLNACEHWAGGWTVTIPDTAEQTSEIRNGLIRYYDVEVDHAA